MRGVLVADDEASIRRLVRASLGSPEYDVLEAADGDEAWGLLRAHRCAVAILDVRLPGTSGLEVASSGDAGSVFGPRLLLCNTWFRPRKRS